MAYQRPGVYVQETLLQSNPDVFPAASAAAFVGVASRGPTDPTLVQSWTQFQRLYGGFTGATQDLAQAVFHFFNNGGGGAYIVRATGASAALATRQLLDRQGTPAPVVRIDSANTGAWGNQTFVEIEDSAIAGRFHLTVRFGGSSDQYIVERWNDLSLDPADGRYAPGVINSAGGGSIYVKFVDLFDRTTVFDPLVNTPAESTVPGGDALTAGANGDAPTTSALATAVEKFSAVDSFLNVNVPGLTESAAVNSVIAWAESRGTAFVVIDCPPTQTPEQVRTLTTPYTDSSYAAVYYPRLSVADPSNNAPGSTRMIAPGGPVLGTYAANDVSRGVHRAPAGTSARLNGVVSLEYKLLDTDLDLLNTAGINAIKVVPGVGFCLFGARTLKPNQIDRYISARRTLISLRMALTEVTRTALFETNDELLWEGIRDSCRRILLELWQEGGLRGASAAEAFFVKCDRDNNPQSSVNNGEVHVDVGVALSAPAEFIILRIGQFESASSVTEVV